MASSKRARVDCEGEWDERNHLVVLVNCVLPTRELEAAQAWCGQGSVGQALKLDTGSYAWP